LRALLGGSVGVTMLGINAALRYRRLAVAEPFARRGVRKYSLKPIGTEPGAAWTHDAVEWLDPDGHRSTRLWPGGHLPRRPSSMSPLRRRHADDAYHALIKDVENGYTRSAALVVPEGPGLALARLWIRADDGRAAEPRRRSSAPSRGNRHLARGPPAPLGARDGEGSAVEPAGEDGVLLRPDRGRSRGQLLWLRILRLGRSPTARC
jgi:hypothetical protein